MHEYLTRFHSIASVCNVRTMIEPMPHETDSARLLALQVQQTVECVSLCVFFSFSHSVCEEVREEGKVLWDNA